MKYLMLALLLPLFGHSQCYENRLAFNFNIGTPYKSGMELSFFPSDGRIGYDAGFYLYDHKTTMMVDKKSQTSEQPEISPIGRIIFRLNQYGDFQHQVTVFGTPNQVGISYRLYYRIGDVLIGIEPTVSTKENGVNALVSFDL
ncbi:MAG TPA: hypothetical protein VHZ50_00205 [Puia sp.]|jgi:hypothetical protein|nr:hypothetical protein [Puia sp.]